MTYARELSEIAAALTVDGSKNVSIGTASPISGSKLTIATATSTASQFVIDNTSYATGQVIGVDFSVAGGSRQAFTRAVIENGSTAATSLTFGTASGGNNVAERMRIDSAGNVGIGTSSPTNFGGTNVNINGASSAQYASLLMVSGAYVMEALVNQNSAVMALGARSNHHLSLVTNDAERIRITSDGYVGIGGAPASYLAVVGTGTRSSGNWSWFGGNSSNPPSTYTYGAMLGTNLSNGNSETNLVWGQGIGSYQHFTIGKWTGSAYTEQMRITSGGNVGIGDSAPDAYGAALVVKRSGQSSIMMWNAGIGSAQIGIGAGSPNLKIYNTYSSGTLAGGVGIDIDTTGRVLLNQGQLSFPDTQNASSNPNTLDDYEEGTWTPTLSSGTMTVRNATYTKIGRSVTVSLWADTFSSTVNIIGGLPFTVLANGYSPGVAHNNSGNAYVARAGTSSTDVYLRNYSDAGVSLNSMGSFLIFTITYFTST